MPTTILNIDTAFTTGFVSVAVNGEMLGKITNEIQKDHATFLQVAVKKLLNDLSISISTLNAVAVNTGPGSYTGLRVAMASAKGLCFALNIPLIVTSSLHLIASAVCGIVEKKDNCLICPMIDARRLEVYTALYAAKNLTEILAPHALILTEDSLKKEIENNKIFFSGDGAEKFLALINHANASYIPCPHLATTLSYISFQQFLKNDFASLAYSEPHYVKAFYDQSQ